MPRDNVLAYTLPGFATSEDKTRAKRGRLMRALGVSVCGDRHRPCSRADAQGYRVIRPLSATRRRLSTMSPSRTFRPDCAPIICFAGATTTAGLVVGTGDLSELGLGWCTYGVGDQMSHYNPERSVAKDPDSSI